MARDFVADGSYGIQVKGKRAFVEESQGGSWAVLKSALVPMSSSQAQRWIDYYIPGASGPSQARILGHLTGGKKNPAKSLTLRNMAVVTVKRLPGGAVAITGRKLAKRANPGGLKSYDIVNGANDQLRTIKAHSAKEALKIWRDRFWTTAWQARGVHAVRTDWGGKADNE